MSPVRVDAGLFDNDVFLPYAHVNFWEFNFVLFLTFLLSSFLFLFFLSFQNFKTNFSKLIRYQRDFES